MANAHATNRQRQNSTRPGRGDRGSHPGGAAPQSPRHDAPTCGVCLPGGQDSPRQEEEAVAWLRRSIETNRNFRLHFFLAAALARLGRLAEARSEAQAGLAINPTFTISRFRAARRAMTNGPLIAARNASSTACARPGSRRMTAARRLAAILAADVVGYSRLMGEDEAGTARAVRRAPRGGAADRRGRSAAGSSRRWATACCWSFPPLSQRSNARSRSRP